MGLNPGHPFGRYYKLTLDDKTYETQIGTYNMDIKFDVTRAKGQHCGHGTLSILGLKRETMERYVRFCGMTRSQAENEHSKIQLEAGYFTPSGLTRVQVFDGHIATANITKPPEMWLNLGIAEWPQQFSEVLEQSIPFYKKGYKCEEIANSVIGRYKGYSFKDLTESVGKEIAHGFPAGKYTLEKAVRELENLNPNWYLVNRGHTIEAYFRDWNKNVKGVNYADEKHGLLGVSGITGTNCEVTTWLQEDDPHLCLLELHSKLVPSANGKYNIIRKRYYGHYRGAEWYTTFFCAGRNPNQVK